MPIGQGHPGLLWSNPNAGEAGRIRAALLRPRFAQLLDITLEFGVERVRQEWVHVAGLSGGIRGGGRRIPVRHQPEPAL